MEYSAARRRGAYAKTAIRRQEILRTAMDVFADSGYEGSSFREIAARVGMSETGLAHHFGSKAALLAAVLQARGQEDGARWREDGSIPVARLRDLVAHNAQRRGLVQLFARLSAEGTSRASPAHDYFTERYENIRRASADSVRRAQSDGTIRPDLNAEIVAQILVAVMDGLQVQWLYDERADMVAALDLLIGTWLSTPGPGRAADAAT